MKKNIYLFLLLLASMRLAAQTTVSKSSGNWNASTNWNNGVPSDGGAATVNHNMILNKHLNINNGDYSITDAGTIKDTDGGTNYNIDVRGSGNLEVSGTVIIGGDLEVRNSGNFILRACDTMIVKGDADFSNNSTITIEGCAVFYVYGNLDISNNNSTLIHGNVVVDGDLTSRNGSSITGTGNLVTNGEVEIRNSSTVFGSNSGCSPGPCDYGTGTGLPIVLVDFSVSRKSCKEVRLNWTTESEINNDYFTLEYSSDGIYFTQIATIEGGGNASKVLKYDFVYEMEAVYRTTYFRLSQTDYDGRTESFNVIALNNSVEDNCGESFSAHVYPNPGNGSVISVDFNGLIGNEVNVIVQNLNGEVLYRDLVSVNLEQGVVLKNVGVLPRGIYFITLINGTKRSTVKYLVTE